MNSHILNQTAHRAKYYPKRFSGKTNIIQIVTTEETKANFRFASLVFHEIKYIKTKSCTFFAILLTRGIRFVSFVPVSNGEREQNYFNSAWRVQNQVSTERAGRERKYGCHLRFLPSISSLTYHSRQDTSRMVSSWIFRLCNLLSSLPHS